LPNKAAEKYNLH